MIASSFDGVSYLLGFPPAGLFIVLAVLSFVPAKSGFRSDLVLSLIATVGGLFLTFGLIQAPRNDQLTPIMWVVFPLPFLLGIASFGLWYFRHRRKR